MPGVFTLGEWEAGSVIRRFEEMTEKAGEVQEAVLKAILQKNARTEYLDGVCGLNGRTDISAFKECVPIVTHAHLLPYFQRIANGDTTQLLTADPVTTLSLSSGTTSDGQQKYLILYKEILQASLELIKIGSAYRARDFPVKPGGRVLELVFCGKLSTSTGGLITGTATTHLFRSEEYKMKQISTKVKSCSPVEVMHGSVSLHSMYCHLLCGLLYWEEVEFINSTFAYTLVEALRSFEAQWRSICEDIRHGHLSSWVSDPHVREAMSNVLDSGNPELADMIRQKCLRAVESDWHGIIPQLWPNCKYVLSIITGSMEHYAKKLEHYAGNVPLVSGDYGATEAWIAVNTNPKANPSDVSYTVIPSFAYFEFIPLQENNKEEIRDEVTGQIKAVGLTEVEIGKEYEILITTYGGLYRYRLGDVVRVTGFLNQSPQLAYAWRKNVSLCINIDKNSEEDLKIVVQKTAKKLKSIMKAGYNKDSKQDSAMYNGAITLEAGNMTTNGNGNNNNNNNGHDMMIMNGHSITIHGINGLNGKYSNGNGHVTMINGNHENPNNDDIEHEYSSANYNNWGGVELLDYTSYADMSTTPGHYVIFWELRLIGCNMGSDPVVLQMFLESSRSFLEDCATAMDVGFVDAGYVGSRRVHTIAPLELCIVRPGTFRSLLDRYLAKGTAITQYKTPRCVSQSQELIRILRSSTLISCFSSAYSH